MSPSRKMGGQTLEGLLRFGASQHLLYFQCTNDPLISPFRATSRLQPNLRDEERGKVGRWMRANKHPPGRDASLPRSSTVVRDWKQSRAAKVPLSSSVSVSPSLGRRSTGRVDGQKKRSSWRVLAAQREGGVTFQAMPSSQSSFFSISTCRLFKLRLSFHRRFFPSFRRARARDRLLQRALPGVAVGDEAGGHWREGRGRGQLAVARPLVGGRVHHGVRRQDEVSGGRNIERETISV